MKDNHFFSTVSPRRRREIQKKATEGLKRYHARRRREMAEAMAGRTHSAEPLQPRRCAIHHRNIGWRPCPECTRTPMTKQEAGRLGAMKRWNNAEQSAAKRSARMAELGRLRWVRAKEKKGLDKGVMPSYNNTVAGRNQVGGGLPVNATPAGNSLTAKDLLVTSQCLDFLVSNPGACIAQADGIIMFRLVDGHVHVFHSNDLTPLLSFPFPRAF